MSKRNEVIEVLKKIIDPELGKDIITLDFVKDLEIIGDKKVEMRLVLTSPGCPLKDYFKNEITKNLKEKLSWVEDVEIAIDAKVPEPFSQRKKIEGVKHIIPVLSGKGGVGKSTIAINIAFALKEMGAKVGLLDADVYGPTISMIGGIKGKVVVEENKMVPPEREGVKIISVGYFTEKESPIIWRGPLIHSALNQFLFDVNWGELDYLIMDLPPGTGDPLISTSQLVHLTGGVVVSTPQDVAVYDVRKAINMLFKVNVSLLGVVENMSYFRCHSCGEVHEIFGKSKVDELVKEIGTEVLGKVPFDPELVSSGDEGEIYVLKYKDRETTKALFDIARKISAKISMEVLKK